VKIAAGRGEKGNMHTRQNTRQERPSPREALEDIKILMRVALRENTKAGLGLACETAYALADRLSLSDNRPAVSRHTKEIPPWAFTGGNTLTRR